MAAKAVTIESALSRPEIREELDDLDAAGGPGGEAEAFRISFFREHLDGLASVASVDPGSLIGQATLINYRSPSSPDFSHSYLYEAIFCAPHLIVDSEKQTPVDLLNNYYHSQRDFEVTVAARTFIIRGVYYCQQNAVTSVCAHACLRMTLNTASSRPLVTNRWINTLLGKSPPLDGLQLQEVQTVLAARGLRQSTYRFHGANNRIDYIPTLYSIIESGFPALLVFSTSSHGTDHVISAFGHTLNSDEWHPQAQNAYAGPSSAPYYSSSNWSDHFLIHDDNFGPYFCFARDSLSTQMAMQPKWVIGLFPTEIIVAPLVAEGIASALWKSLLPQLQSDPRSPWLDYILSKPYTYVMRTLLLSKDEYLRHLRESKSHDGSAMTEGETNWFLDLPDQFWMTEITLPSLYTGNKSKLAEILISSTERVDVNRPFGLFLGMRLPATVVRMGQSGTAEAAGSSLIGHSPLYRRLPVTHEW